MQPWCAFSHHCAGNGSVITTVLGMCCHWAGSPQLGSRWGLGEPKVLGRAVLQLGFICVMPWRLWLAVAHPGVPILSQAAALVLQGQHPGSPHGDGSGEGRDGSGMHGFALGAQHGDSGPFEQAVYWKS